MTFPSVQSVANSQQTSDTTSHTVTMPSGLASGDLAAVFFVENGAHAGDGAITFPAGWTKVQGGSLGNVTAAWGYRVADGGEGGSITITTADSEQSATTVYRITGHDSSTNPPQSLTYWNYNNTGAPNPDTLTPTGGAKDYLWIVACGADSGYQLTAGPTSYTDLTVSDSGSTANVSVAMSTCRREYNAASHNPSAATLEGAEDALIIVVAVHPGAEGGGGGTAVTLDPFGMSGFFGA